MHRRRSRRGGADASQKLTAAQKCDIATRELEKRKREADQHLRESERVCVRYRAMLEEVAATMEELKRFTYEFEREVVRGSIHPISGNVIAERVVRHHDEKLKARDTLIEKLRLKSAALRAQMAKLRLQLRQKEELGEVLQEVDFSQLKIENKQYLERIEERNQQLLDLKRDAGSHQHALNRHKVRIMLMDASSVSPSFVCVPSFPHELFRCCCIRMLLSHAVTCNHPTQKNLGVLSSEYDQVRADIGGRTELLARLEEEATAVEDERLRAQRRNQLLRKQMAEYKVPPVLDYVHEKADLDILRKSVAQWSRKVRVADVTLKRYRRAWRLVERDVMATAAAHAHVPQLHMPL